MTQNIFETGLDKNGANYQALSPIGFLARSATVYPERVAVIHGARRLTYTQVFERSRRLASALQRIGIGKGSTVSVMAANIPAFLEAHFGVPASGAVFNALNTRLDAAGLAFILDHAECDVLFIDSAFAETMREALSLCSREPLVIDIADSEIDGAQRLGSHEYEDFILTGSVDFPWQGPQDEWQSIALNYTSGTTGNPKGVVYSHRGAYLNAIGNAVSWPLGNHPVYLWTLPMFHCNGWCFPWTITMAGGTHVCLRQPAVRTIVQSFADHNVTHFCGAPIVLNMIRNAPENLQRRIPRGIQCMTAGAAPPVSVIEGLEELGFKVTHAYGLTEVYGPCVINVWKDRWNTLPGQERAVLNARQGVRYVTQENMDVLDVESNRPVAADGESIGEVVFRGNTTMKGYLKNVAATTEAFAGDWFRSGDLAVKHEDNYIEIRDRSKDIIISGGENISSIEVENVLFKHSAVLEAAVVAVLDEKWGETPCAFVTLKEGMSATRDDIKSFCRDNLAHFKCPSKVVFQDLPKTSTGKVQKFILRKVASET